MTTENKELLAEIERLKADNAKLKANERKAPPLTLKVSPKGCLSLYGNGRFPVSLYKSQWQRLIGFIPQVEKFIAEHSAELKDKAPKEEVAQTEA